MVPDLETEYSTACEGVAAVRRTFHPTGTTEEKEGRAASEKSDLRPSIMTKIVIDKRRAVIVDPEFRVTAVGTCDGQTCLFLHSKVM